MDEIWLLYSTFPNRDEALSAARALVESRLAACANVHDIVSVYRWEGALHEGTEAALIAKTRREKLQEASEAVKRLHSYEVPCIIAYPIAGGFPPFLQWVADETA
jgi:periplasmic divalent cation tolerance protein